MFVCIPLFKTIFFSLNLVNKESESEQDSRHSGSTTQRAGGGSTTQRVGDIAGRSDIVGSPT